MRLCIFGVTFVFASYFGRLSPHNQVFALRALTFLFFMLSSPLPRPPSGLFKSLLTVRAALKMFGDGRAEVAGEF
jgi:hypothetical protein